MRSQLRPGREGTKGRPGAALSFRGFEPPAAAVRTLPRGYGRDSMTPRRLREPARLAGAVLRTQSDERLVDLVRDGNDRAFEAIVHRYRRPLLRYCGRYLAPPRAEDAVQQTF